METHSIRESNGQVPWASAIMAAFENDMACAIRSDASVMISGERGAGRKFVARLIHQRSRRGSAPFVIANCRDLRDRSPRSTAGSASAKLLVRGLSEWAGGGTLVLDELQKIPVGIQLPLLQSIESELTTHTHPRLMTTTSPDLFERVRSKWFRSDLFYRLNVIHLIVPPLRERREDIPMLFDHYLSTYASAGLPRFSHDALQRLLSYHWPGNVQELKAAAEILAEQGLARSVEVDDLPSHLRGSR